jgi:hypothetical protein
MSALNGQSIASSLAATLLLVSGTANAASVSYFIDQSNDLPDNVNYLQVTISDGLAGNIDFSVALLAGAFPAPLPNFGVQAFFFNYDQSLSVDMTNIINFDPASWGISEDQNAGGGIGKFQFEVVATGSTRTSLLTFSIAGVTGDTVNSYAMGNPGAAGSDEFFAAHAANNDGPGKSKISRFASSTVAFILPVPIPAAAYLFGSALLGLGWFRKVSA